MQDLTHEQQAALELEGRTNVMIAGPGSGKTHTLIARLTRDAEQENPAGLVCVTFTNAAAREIRERLEDRGINHGRFRHIGTLHSWATREILKTGQSVRIASDSQIHEAIAKVKVQAGAMARNMSGAAIWRAAVDLPRFGTAATVGKAVRNQLREAGLTHHDLILPKFLGMIEAGEVETPARVYVDEFQDTAAIDSRIYGALRGHGARLFLIGDPRQAIFGFRGASPTFIMEAWGQADARAQLTANFRSGVSICWLATQIARRLFAPGTTPCFDPTVEPVSHEANEAEWRVVAHRSQHDELIAAAGWMEAQQAAGRSCAILTRYNSQAIDAAEILRSRNLSVTSSTDRAATQPGAETVKDSLAKLQQWAAEHLPPQTFLDAIDWPCAMTRLGIPFSNQSELLGEVQQAVTLPDLLAIGDTEGPASPCHVATIHAAKGLEWDAVWVLGADRDAFKATDPEHGRLLFVAATRARRYLTISHAKSRPDPGSGQARHNLQPTEWI